MKLLVGSNRESRFGVGELFTWTPEELYRVEHTEDGSWVVYDKKSGSVECYRVMVLEGEADGSIKEIILADGELNEYLGLHSMSCECTECHNSED